MLNIVVSNRFKKDLKQAMKRQLDMATLNGVVDKLANGEALPAKHRDHELSGDYSGFRECHIAPDWLLIYRVEAEDLILYLFRTGTHSDLF